MPCPTKKKKYWNWIQPIKMIQRTIKIDKKNLNNFCHKNLHLFRKNDRMRERARARWSDDETRGRRRNERAEKEIDANRNNILNNIFLFFARLLHFDVSAHVHMFLLLLSFHRQFIHSFELFRFPYFIFCIFTHVSRFIQSAFLLTKSEIILY